MIQINHVLILTILTSIAGSLLGSCDGVLFPSPLYGGVCKYDKGTDPTLQKIYDTSYLDPLLW